MSASGLPCHEAWWLLREHPSLLSRCRQLAIASAPLELLASGDVGGNAHSNTRPHAQLVDPGDMASDLVWQDATVVLACAGAAHWHSLSQRVQALRSLCGALRTVAVDAASLTRLISLYSPSLHRCSECALMPLSFASTRGGVEWTMALVSATHFAEQREPQRGRTPLLAIQPSAFHAFVTP